MLTNKEEIPYKSELYSCTNVEEQIIQIDLNQCLDGIIGELKVGEMATLVQIEGISS